MRVWSIGRWMGDGWSAAGAGRTVVTVALCMVAAWAAAVPASGSAVMNEVAKLLPLEGEALENFGVSMAMAGDTAVLGASGDDELGTTAGAAYVFERNGAGEWVERAKLVPSDGGPGDRFAVSVAIAGDTVVVGSYGDDELGPDAGAAYVFERDEAGQWLEKAKLVASDGSPGERFGVSVAATADTVLVGAHLAGGVGLYSGAVYVFTRDGAGGWRQEEKLVASDAAAQSYFGSSVAASGDVAVVGAWGDDTWGTDAGAAYVFARDEAGAWVEAAKLVADQGSALDYFGNAVAVDGEVVVAGAWGSDGAGDSSGSAYVFERAADGGWRQVGRLVSADAGEFDTFGYRVAVSGDTVVVGAYGVDDHGSQSGAAFTFVRDFTGAWSEADKLLASDGAALDAFGSALAISSGTVFVGAYLDDDLGTASGSVYVFELAPDGAVALCLRPETACDSYYLVATRLAEDLWRLRGYQYGCGVDTRLVGGTMHELPQKIVIGLTGGSGGGPDGGMLCGRTVTLDPLTWRGEYRVLCEMKDGGAIGVQCGGGKAVLSSCPEPGGPTAQSSAAHGEPRKR